MIQTQTTKSNVKKNWNVDCIGIFSHRCIWFCLHHYWIYPIHLFSLKQSKWFWVWHLQQNSNSQSHHRKFVWDLWIWCLNNLYIFKAITRKQFSNWRSFLAYLSINFALWTACCSTCEKYLLGTAHPLQPSVMLVLQLKNKHCTSMLFKCYYFNNCNSRWLYL